MKNQNRDFRAGVTLIEIAVVMVIVGVLIGVGVPAYAHLKARAAASTSSSHLRALVAANQAYSAENKGFYCPATSRDNRTRWHGGRDSSRGAFDPAEGYLGPYIQSSRNVFQCPVFKDYIKGGASFEDGAGAYGYNHIYIGGLPENFLEPNRGVNVPHKSKTVMFTSSAFAVGEGFQEYPFCEPYRWVDPNWRLGGELQPSVHFRYGGKALVAWCDGHVTLEAPEKLGGPNYYGGNNQKHGIGWFGPEEENGYWNPRYLDYLESKNRGKK